MTLFMSDEEYARCSHDPSLIAQKADAYIRELYNQIETEKAQYDASSITAEQTCSILEQKYVSLKSEFSALQSQHSQLNSTLEERVSELAQIQADKHQIYLQSIGKDGEIERLSLEASELQKSKSQLLQMIEHKDLELNEKNTSIKGYLDKIVSLTENTSSKDSRTRELEAELARLQTSLARSSQEKELVERHNVWLNDELTTKVNNLLELRKSHNELEADMSSKLSDLERKYNDTCTSLKWKDDRVKELQSKLEALQEELCKSKDTSAATEERLSAELATVNKLVELYKENSDEWSKKAGELEGVIKALETHASQVEKDYKEKLEKETSSRKQFESEVSVLKEKLEKLEAELERSRNSDQFNLLQMTTYNPNLYKDSTDTENNNLMIVPSIPAGISGTALAASLLRDGWSLVKMYEKYQEAVDALRHEQMGRKHSESILERVLHEIEEKADVIQDERAEHERMVDAYDMLNEKLQHSLSEQTYLERTLQELKAELKRHERDYKLSQMENKDLQKQVTVLLKECRDIQLRCGSVNNYDNAIEDMSMSIDHNVDFEFSNRLLTFKDINGLVEQNVQLRGFVRLLTEQVESKEAELKEKFDREFQKHNQETTSKVDAVIQRAEEQARMIESLHTSVAMYKKLYEEEHKRLLLESPDTAQAERRSNTNTNSNSNVTFLLEGSNDASKRAQEKAYERIKALEEELNVLRSDIITLKSQRDKSTLEATFAHEKLERFMKDFEHQREEMNGVLSRNVEFSQLIVDYQRKIREANESLNTAEDLSRKLNMEVSVVKREKEMLINSEKRAFEEVRELSERVHQLQATLNTVQSTEEVKEEARSAERMREGDYVKRTEREWADAKKELQEERDNVRKLTLEHESAMRTAMQRIEEMGKELSTALREAADANARAAAAEERCLKFEKTLSSEVNDGNAPTKEDVIRELKEEVEKLRVEAKTNKEHMMQYKSIAQVNEDALKQMEASHESFKNEAEKVKKSLEDEILLLKEEVNRLQEGYNLKAKEAVSASVSQEEALSLSLSEISSLRDECTSKMLLIESLESQMAAMKDDLEKEHAKWRTAQDNYERQVILQSETIQELTKTSQALAVLQQEASDLRKISDTLKIENQELKNKWETEKKVLEDSRDRAEKKYNEINEQNKILHDQFEALHIKSAEKSSGSNDNTFDDTGLQNVVKYLRRSKEIAETEISLLKQEKLRLQSQLESALKSEETAQGLLRAERENSRSVHFTEEEFKALQLQVREMNLLRESNVQLREENKHNFEECQKLRNSTHTVRAEIENLESLLGERVKEVESCKREIEVLKKERDELQKRFDEVVDRFRGVDPEEYGRMRADLQDMKVKNLEKDGNLEEVKKVVSEKQEVIVRLEHEVLKSKTELEEREAKINSYNQSETTMKTEIDKQKRFLVQLKRRSDMAVREKDELAKKNQELSKELADSKKTGGGGSSSGVDSEQAAKEREEKDSRIQILERTVEKLREESKDREEKDKRIQMLEKTIERLREDVRRGKEEVKNEKAKNLKGITDSQKLVDELDKHKQALKTLSDEIEKINNSGDSIDEVAAACVVAVENFEQVVNQVSTEFGLPVTTADPPAVESAVPPAVTTTPLPAVTPAQKIEESAKPVSGKVEARKGLRKLVRPRLKTEQQKVGTDVDMSDTGGTQSSSVRKRPSEGSQSHARETTGSDVAAAPVVKKSRPSEQPTPDSATAVDTQPSIDTIETLPDETAAGDESQSGKEEVVDTGKEEEDVEEQAGEEPTEAQNDVEVVMEGEVATGEGVSEPEEGEMMTDNQETAEGDEQRRAGSASPMPLAEDEVADEGEMEMGSPLLTMEDNEDKNEEGEIEAAEEMMTPESSLDNKVVVNTDGVDEDDKTTTSTTTTTTTTSVAVTEPEVKPEEPVAAETQTSRTINLNERARLRSQERMAGTLNSAAPLPARGRGRVVPRGRTIRGARTSRGTPPPASQGGGGM